MIVTSVAATVPPEREAQRRAGRPHAAGALLDRIGAEHTGEVLTVEQSFPA